MKRKLYQHLASRVEAMQRCKTTGNTEWYDKHGAVIATLCKEHMPSGSGFDNGTRLNLDKSGAHRLEFDTGGFHHMNDNGMYDGWTDHGVIVTPSLAFGFDLRITGRNRNDIKEYIGEVFNVALSQDIDDAEVRGIIEPEKESASEYVSTSTA